MIRSYYSNGKLLLSGEYLVLLGASSLVVPLKVGMRMNVVENGYDEKPLIHWKANVLGEPWFMADLSAPDWKVLDTNNSVIAASLVKELKEAGNLNPLLYESKMSFDIATETGFNPDWGFGSSSALTANIAQWATIDPFELHFRISEGSGADIAAAISGGPVLYKITDQKPDYHRVDFHPSFLNKLWLIYKGNKQSSSLSVSQFRENSDVSSYAIGEITDITLKMIQAKSLRDFMILMSEHEMIISEILNIPPAKEIFADFPGEIKSLGAWGGDFIMAATENDELTVREYFRSMQMLTVFSFDQIAL
jgi:mevalonate kinase